MTKCYKVFTQVSRIKSITGWLFVEFLYTIFSFLFNLLFLDSHDHRCMRYFNSNEGFNNHVYKKKKKRIKQCDGLSKKIQSFPEFYHLNKWTKFRYWPIIFGFNQAPNPDFCRSDELLNPSSLSLPSTEPKHP